MAHEYQETFRPLAKVLVAKLAAIPRSTQEEHSTVRDGGRAMPMCERRSLATLSGIACLLLQLGVHAQGMPGEVLGQQKISAVEGGFTGTLDVMDVFGLSLASLGDVNGDGVPDVAVGAPGDDDGGFGHGALWLLYLRADGTVARHSKISDMAGMLGSGVVKDEGFGRSVTQLDDLDLNGMPDLAVGSFVSVRGAIRRCGKPRSVA